MPLDVCLHVRSDPEQESDQLVIFFAPFFIVTVQISDVSFDKRWPVGLFPSWTLTKVTPIWEDRASLEVGSVFLKNALCLIPTTLIASNGPICDIKVIQSPVGQRLYYKASP